LYGISLNIRQKGFRYSFILLKAAITLVSGSSQCPAILAAKLSLLTRFGMMAKGAEI
jgi:hypothetical protein